MKLLDRLANAFPLWVLVACGLALIQPDLFTALGDHDDLHDARGGVRHHRE